MKYIQSIQIQNTKYNGKYYIHQFDIVNKLK